MTSEKIPTWWKETTLGKVGKVITWKTPSKHNPEDWWDSIDFITPSDIFGETKYIKKTSRKLSDIWWVRFKKMIIPSNSVIVTCIGSDMGKVVINKQDCLTNQQINSLIVKQEFCVDFIYYKLKNSYSILRSRAWGGSTMPILNKTDFESLQFYLPPLPEQQAIADMLSAFDAKIELLREQNETLEKIAQTLFQEWFGRYSIDRPEELPEGWRVGRLGEIDFISFGDGNYSAKYPKQSDFVDKWIPFISNRDLSKGTILSNDLRYISHEQHSILKKWHLKQWDILISTRANIWDIALVSPEFEDANINAQLVFIRSNNCEIYSNFLYIIFSSNKYRSIFESYSSWSAQAQLPMHALRQIEIIIPDKELLISFSKTVNPIFQKIQTNLLQIQSLSKTRDTLLPKLMSGEVRVV